MALNQSQMDFSGMQEYGQQLLHQLEQLEQLGHLGFDSTDQSSLPSPSELCRRFAAYEQMLDPQHRHQHQLQRSPSSQPHQEDGAPTESSGVPHSSIVGLARPIRQLPRRAVPSSNLKRVQLPASNSSSAGQNATVADDEGAALSANSHPSPKTPEHVPAFLDQAVEAVDVKKGHLASDLPIRDELDSKTLSDESALYPKQLLDKYSVSIGQVSRQLDRLSWSSDAPVQKQKTSESSDEQQQQQQQQKQHQTRSSEPVLRTLQQLEPRQGSDPASQEAKPFRFEQLPPALVDDSFHFRQRAALLILLCSQDANAAKMSMLNRLSLPLAPSANSTANDRRSNSSARPPVTASKSGNQSHHHGHHDHHHDGASDVSEETEGDALDFDACRTAYLGNTKKRKSSRSDSPGPVITTSASANSGTATILPSRAGAPSSHRSSSAKVTPLKSLSLNQDHLGRSTASHITYDCQRDSCEEKHRIHAHPTATGPASTWSPSSAATLWLRPYRQTRTQRSRSMLRSRIRTRLLHTYLQRRRERSEAEQQAHRMEQAKREAEEAERRAEEASHIAATPEKKPAKRMSQAAKRAQALRGASSGTKAMSIAALKARAAGTGASPNKSGTSSSATAPSLTTAQQTTPTKGSDRKAAPAAVSEASPDRATTQQELASDTPPSHSAIVASVTDPAQTKQEPVHVETEKKPVADLPSSSFKFRMSSLVTFRLRELRSQVDVASSNLSESLDQNQKGMTDMVTALHKMALGGSDDKYDPPMPQLPGAPSLSGHDSQDPLKLKPPPTNAPSAPASLSGSTQHNDEKTAASSVATRRPSSQSGNSVGLPPSANSSPDPATKGTSSSIATTRKTSKKGKAAKQTSSHKASSASSHKHTHAHTHTHTHGDHGRGGCTHHGHEAGGMDGGPFSALFGPDDWICIFCEYELYYGEPPLMLRACRNRKKLVAKKNKAKIKAKAALSGNMARGSSSHSHHHHHHDHEHDHHHHHDHHDGCDHDHHHGHHDHLDDQGRARGGGDSISRSYSTSNYEHERDRCDCGNSIHDSDIENEVEA